MEVNAKYSLSCLFSITDLKKKKRKGKKKGKIEKKEKNL